MRKNENISLADSLTVVIKTFERPDMVSRAVASLRSIHPTLPVIVADDSSEPLTFQEDPNTAVIQLPFDSGISYGRNRAIEMVNTPYYLLIDDDHCFAKDCNLEALVQILDETDFDIVAMKMLNYRPTKDICLGEFHYAGTLEREGDALVHYIGRKRGKHQGYPIYDIVLNCYAARKEKAEKVCFDEVIKIAHEHRDYFLRAKAAGLKVTISNNSFIHHRPVYSKNYMNFRRRVEEFTQHYFNKHHISSERTVGKNYTLLDKLKYYPRRLSYAFKKKFGASHG